MESKRKDWDKVIDDLAKDFDLSAEDGKNRAYKNCVTYAEKHMEKDPMVNAFLAHAADRLGAVRVMRDVAREIVPMPEEAMVHVAYDYYDGPIITGNREGLQYLAKVLQTLAKSPVSGEHAHFYWDEAPLTGETYSFVVYIEDDDWFDANAFDYYSSQEDEAQRPRRELEAESVIAIQFTLPLSSTLPVTPGKIYLVSEVVKRVGDEVWTKMIRDDDTRLWVFTIRDDDQEETRIAIDLDDPEITFLTRAELEQILM